MRDHPVVHDFLDRAREFYDDPASGLDADERRQFADVFKFRQRMARARDKIKIDLDNIEQLFGLVEMYQRTWMQPGETRLSTVYLIAKTLELATKANAYRHVVSFTPQQRDPFNVRPAFRVLQGYDPTRYEVDIYDFFAHLVAGLLDDPAKRLNRTDTVITFNYDLVLDDALRRAGVRAFYHLPTGRIESQTPNGRIESQQAGGPDADRTVSVLKLHGSTNWGVCGKCKNVLVMSEKVTASPAEFRSLRCPNCGSLSCYHPLLVPPSWDKSEYREIMQRVWQTAINELSEATRICIIGYSVPETDLFFKYLVTLALSENNRLNKLIVVDRSPKIEAKYEELLEPLFKGRRFQFVGEGFEAFLARNLRVLGRGELVGNDVR